MKHSVQLIALALLIGLALRVGAQSVVVPEDKEIALAGKVHRVHGYGPPGYGEDKKRDSRIVYWVLELTKTVNVQCTPERPEWASEDCSSAKQLRLFFPTTPANNGLEQKARTMQGHRVIVTGVLHRSDTVGEITPIYMNVVEIEPVKTQ